MGLEKGEKERRDKHILVARGERGRDISLARSLVASGDAISPSLNQFRRCRVK